MSTRAYAVRDSVTMLRRNLLHAKRYPVSTTGTLVVPILLLLAFAGLFGNALGTGLGVISNGAIDYTDYLTPAVLVIAAASGALSTALSVNLDMTAGIINRFRTMAISRAAVLTGHVLASVLQTIIAIVRKRLMMPALMSRLTLSAVDRPPDAAAITMTVGVR